jgi:hypothetical protein
VDDSNAVRAGPFEKARRCAARRTPGVPGVLALLVASVERENVLGEINPNEQNGHAFAFRVS